MRRAVDMLADDLRKGGDAMIVGEARVIGSSMDVLEHDGQYTLLVRARRAHPGIFVSLPDEVTHLYCTATMEHAERLLREARELA